MNTTILAKRPTRGRAVSTLVALIFVLGLLVPTGAVRAQDEESVRLAEVPSTGASRPGPIARVESTPQAVVAVDAEVADEAVVPEGVAPIWLQIDKIGVDHTIEIGDITDDGQMVDPTGPWVITWYEEIALVGQGTNVVMAGHVDYYNTGPNGTPGPAVLWGVVHEGLVEGDVIRVLAEDDLVFEYAVEWSQMYNVATDLTPEVLTELVGDTGQESLTIITCGGPFDPATGEYLERVVVRANLI